VDYRTCSIEFDKEIFIMTSCFRGLFSGGAARGEEGRAMEGTSDLDSEFVEALPAG